MSIDVEDFRLCIVRPALNRIGIQSEETERLLIGTAAVESDLGSVLKNPLHRTSGIYQMHGVTHRHIWDDYLANLPDLASKVRGIASQRDFLKQPHTEMMTNMLYATVVTWLAYARHPGFSIPKEPSVLELAILWKRYYHTRSDLKIADFVRQFNKHVPGAAEAA